MTRKLLAVLLASLVLVATPFAGAAVAADAGNTAGNDSTEETAGNDSTTEGNQTGNVSDGDATAFGLQVSEFVHHLQSDSDTSLVGPLVASFVVANNPGNAPAHAGPPAWLFGGAETGNRTAQSADTGPSENGTRGPPGEVGPSDDATQGPPSDAGPPEDAGPPADTDPSGQQGPPSDGDERRGPPEGAGPPR